MFSEGYKQRRKREILQRLSQEKKAIEVTDGQKRTQERLKRLKETQSKEAEEKKKHKEDLDNLKRMRINHNIMESATRIAGYSRSDFIKVPNRICTNY
jgi:membrane protein involved in colicin uptake